jgi:hypothetical protein
MQAAKTANLEYRQTRNNPSNFGDHMAFPSKRGWETFGIVNDIALCQ